ncbi:hypothetical protein DASC09_053010 [Saccharomycopsis crataegensis]|uniref:Major facilitator superfamily (MFS) profile domain-containing protein n=1 Tax=Saccharomycopsis crataegensis TaxID=43959 RepID=A0AAV5QTE0_9ASCO|nr:hypothetical protein DASC09_053010 [Saccharomycopsis crataegensis]
MLESKIKSIFAIHQSDDQIRIHPTSPEPIDLEKQSSHNVTTVKHNDENSNNNNNPYLVTWDSPQDPKNPRNWTMAAKITITIMTSLDAFITSFASTTISPAMEEISVEFGFPTNETLASLCVSIFILPWIFVPLVVSPLSEIYGRKIVLLVCTWGLFFFNIGCAWSQNTSQLLVCRFFAGFFSSSTLSVGPGALGDAFDNKSRTKATGLYAIALVLGPVISPIISGFVVQYKGWRWVLKILTILNAAILVLNHAFLKESFEPILLARKKQQLMKKDPENAEKYHTAYELNNMNLSTWRFLQINISRPILLLFYHPMVYGLGAFLAFTNGFLYLMIVIFPTVWASLYGFSMGISGLMFVTMGIGFLLGIALWTPSIDFFVNRSLKANNGKLKPEYKLKLLWLGGIIAPAGMLGFGWCVDKHVHWIVPSIFAAIFAFGTVNVFQIINNYLIDMDPAFSASAVAAATVFRSIFGFTFPLFAPKFYAKLKFGWGNTFFFFIGMILGIPYPIYAYYRGEKLRKWGSKKLSDFNDAFYKKLGLQPPSIPNLEGCEDEDEEEMENVAADESKEIEKEGHIINDAAVPPPSQDSHDTKFTQSTMTTTSVGSI